tara:strand:+ start:2781 stop:3473 length:693 start_codon:yes stop_codon:yes gene_type:complete
MILNLFQKLDDAFSYLTSNSINEKKFLKSFFLNKKISFVDVGANVGSFTDMLKNNLNIKKGFLFEPSTTVYNELVKKFDSEKFQIHNFALSNINKKKRLFYEYALSSQSSLYKQNGFFNSFNDLKKKSYVETRKFDDFLNHNNPIDLCKIDTQGEDLNVLKGMTFFLKNKLVKLIKIEITFFEFYKDIEIDYLKIINFMNKYDYKLLTISKIKFEKNKVLFLDAYFAVRK